MAPGMLYSIIYAKHCILILRLAKLLFYNVITLNVKISVEDLMKAVST